MVELRWPILISRALLMMAGFAVPTSLAAQSFDPQAIDALLKAQPDTPPQPAGESSREPSKEPAKQARPVRASEPAVPKPSPEELYLSKDPQPAFAPSTVDLTEEAAKKYLAIVEQGGWPVVPSDMKLVPGASGPAVAILKQRLAVTGDLDAEAAQSDVYDAAVETAIRHYQERLGLEQTGWVGGQTLRALNVTAIVRYNQLLASAKRLRTTKFAFGPRYVVVNIPSANVEAVKDGAVVRRYVAVVGKPDHASPMVTTKITTININPTWTVPASIVKNEIIAHMRANPGYLAKEHIRILDKTTGTEVDQNTIDWTGNSAEAFMFRQDSGSSNSLGTLRIDMPNKDAVFMHDTPSKGLFAASIRFQSHGCVRVSKVQNLAAWLLENNTSPDPAAPNQTGWTAEAISAAIALGTRMDVKLTEPVPVAWVYLTGYATPDRVVHFRSDIYNLDDPDTTASVPPVRPQPQTSTLVKRPVPLDAQAVTRVE